MARTTLLLERLPPVLNLRPSWIERELKALRAAKLIEPSADFTDRLLAYVLMGTAGAQPSDAPEAVDILRTQRWVHSAGVPDDIGSVLPTFEDMLAHWIRDAGAARLNGADWVPESKAVLHSFEVQMCLDPAHVIITATGLDGGAITHLYVTNPTAPRPARRCLTILSGEVLLAAGEMWADTVLERQRLSLRDTTSSRTGSEEEKAGYPRQGMPALFDDQSRANGPGGLEAPPQGICENKVFQGYGSGRTGRLIETSSSEATNPSQEQLCLTMI